MHIKNKRGQSTVEYVLLVTAVIAVLIALLTSSNNGVQAQLNSTINSALEQIDTMSGRLANSEYGTTAPGAFSPPPYTVTVAP